MTPFLAALNAFFGGKNRTSKNALSEVYLTLLQVLSNEYTDYVAKFDAVSGLTAAINLELQIAVRSNKLEREEGKKNLKKKRVMFLFLKRKKTEF